MRFADLLLRRVSKRLLLGQRLGDALEDNALSIEVIGTNSAEAQRLRKHKRWLLNLMSGRPSFSGKAGCP